ncbi:MAG: hypothetical protein KDB00_02990 [Planctomycetales bacterium]|nr:hypothetical protein [Planctomycetales bacterium]
MNCPIPKTECEILAGVIAPRLIEVSSGFRHLHFPVDDLRRISELHGKECDGTALDFELDELAMYQRVGNLLTWLQMAAKQLSDGNSADGRT